jgi:DNA primase
MTNYNYKEIILKQLDFGRFFADYGYNLNGKKTNHKCCFHDDNNPSLSIDPPLFMCHACGKKGSIFDWYMFHHNVDFKEALIQIADKYNIELPQNKNSKKQGSTKEQLTDELIETCHQALPEDIRAYLNKRGIPNTLIDKYKLGWGEFYGKYWILIPVKNKNGEYALLKLRKLPTDTRKKTPKMLTYPRGTEHEIYDYETVKNNNELVICEGEFDKLVLETKGIAAITSTGGAANFKEKWIKEYLKDKGKLTVCFDSDKAGREGAEKLIKMLLETKNENI